MEETWDLHSVLGRAMNWFSMDHNRDSYDSAQSVPYLESGIPHENESVQSALLYKGKKEGIVDVLLWYVPAPSIALHDKSENISAHCTARSFQREGKHRCSFAQMHLGGTTRTAAVITPEIGFITFIIDLLEGLSLNKDPLLWDQLPDLFPPRDSQTLT